MRLQHVLVPGNALIVSVVVGLSVASVPVARGQAIVTYGASVGRAAGAGAAAGTGAAGIFDKLNRTTADASKREAKGQPHAKAGSEVAPKSPTPNAITIGGDGSGDNGDSTTVRTASGISIAGLVGPKSAIGPDPSTAQRQPAHPLSEPTEVGPTIVSSPDPAPVASPAARPSPARAAESSAAPAARREIEASAASPATALESGPAMVIGDGITPRPLPAATPFAITPGTPVQDLIKLLGRPLMRLSGIEGADYDERYVFLTASGSKVTILAQDGRVLRVIVDEP